MSATWLIVNARWLVLYRRKQLLEIDEAGYVSMAVNDYQNAVRGGLSGWVTAIEWPGIQAPLTPALTSLQFFVTGPNVLAAFAVPLLAGLAVVLLTYAIAHRLAGPKLAWPALVLIATAPGLIVESRAYHFGAPAAAVTLAALYFLIRSQNLAKLGASLTFGVFLGLMPLTRTMTIAFIPALVLAGFVQAVVGEDRRRRLIHFAGALALAAGVAGLWLVPNGALVYRYLVGFGYGPQAAEYGTDSGVFNPVAWVARLRMLILEQYLPHVVVLCVGLALAIYVAIRRARANGFREFTRSAVRSPLFPLAVLVAEGLAAFASSRTNGNGFSLPLIPPMVLVALWGLYSAHVRLRRVLPYVVAIVGVVAVVPLVDLRLPTARPLLVDIPGLGLSKVADGRGVAQVYSGLGLDSMEPEPISPEDSLAWIASVDWASQMIIDNHALQGMTAFGFRDRLFNVNTVELAMLQKKGFGVAVTQIKPTEAGSTLADYQRWLTVYQDSLSGEASKACLLFTATGTQNEFLPVVDPPAMAQAAATTGFSSIAERTLPNGRIVTLWHRDQPTCRVGTP
ncbi:ArnT family glycosyltransferase [Amycolatopsis sp. cg5]|uniref:ArnT family glycosyltransferase n=1 Tax=Amycolatopsis sp. cg5 TaxID=3238802 RepID=UPI00352572DD